MSNNAELQVDVQNAIKWEPILHDVAIGVIVNEGIVTLTKFRNQLCKTE